jgi:hypothetical protein
MFVCKIEKIATLSKALPKEYIYLFVKVFETIGGFMFVCKIEKIATLSNALPKEYIYIYIFL